MIAIYYPDAGVQTYKSNQIKFTRYLPYFSISVITLNNIYFSSLFTKTYVLKCLITVNIKYQNQNICPFPANIFTVDTILRIKGRRWFSDYNFSILPVWLLTQFLFLLLFSLQKKPPSHKEETSTGQTSGEFGRFLLMNCDLICWSQVWALNIQSRLY